MMDWSQVTIAYGSGQTVTMLELVKQKLGITDISRDDELTLVCQMAGEAAERYCDNVLALRSVSEQISHYKHPVALRYSPYSDGLTVGVDGVDVTDDFTPYHDEGLQWAVKATCGNYQNCCFEQMTLTYNAGFDPLPADLGWAISQGAVGYEANGGGGSGPVRKESIVGVGSIEYAVPGESEGGMIGGWGTFPAAAMATLESYKRLFA